MTNNTSIVPRSSFETMMNAQTVVLQFVDSDERAALGKTCRFFYEFLQRQEVYTDLLRNCYPLSNPSLLCSHSTFFTRLTLVPTNMKLGPIGRVTFYPNFNVQCIKLFPSGTQFLATCVDNSILRYDLETGNCVTIGSDYGIDQLQITSDENNALVVSGHIVNIMDLKTGWITQLTGHEGDIQCVKVNGKNVYTGSEDNTVKCWNFKSGECTKTIPMPKEEDKKSRILQISRDGTMAISELGRKMIVWSLETGKVLQTLEGYQAKEGAPLIMSEISFDKTKVISSHGREIHIWDLTTGESRLIQDSQLFSTHDDPFLPPTAIILGMVTTADLKRAILSYSNCDVVNINFETGDQLPVPNHTISRCMEISPYGETVIIADPDNIKIYDFTLLPEERLTKVARQLSEEMSERAKDKSPQLRSVLFKLPFALRHAIPGLFGRTLSENVDNINAAELGLPSIHRLLKRALKQPNYSNIFVGEAVRRINNLSPSIKDAVCRHFAEINGGGLTFGSLSENQSLIPQGLEAIRLTIEEFKFKWLAAWDGRTKWLAAWDGRTEMKRD